MERTHFLEMSGREDFSDGLHKCISDDDGDITSRVSIISIQHDFGEYSATYPSVSSARDWKS